MKTTETEFVEYVKIPSMLFEFAKEGMDARIIILYNFIAQRAECENLIALPTDDLVGLLNISPKSKHIIIKLLKEMHKLRIIKACQIGKYRYVKLLLNIEK